LPGAIRLRGLEMRFGTRTYVMGILNLTPDSFSGDGLLARAVDPLAAAVAQGTAMVAAGADILDVGGESTRPGHRPVSAADELARTSDVVAALRAALPEVPISIDTSKEAVASAALDAGADLVNDVTAVTGRGELAALAAARDVPYVVMHDRARPPSDDVVKEVLTDLQSILRRAEGLGCRPGQLIVDPGIGFGKSALENLVLLRELRSLRALGRPILLGASRKSTIGRVLDLPPAERLEGTLAVTALAIASGVDIVRVHDVGANLRAARMADAIVRGWHPAPGT
jgi:dihydropteroate synthase